MIIVVGIVLFVYFQSLETEYGCKLCIGPCTTRGEVRVCFLLVVTCLYGFDYVVMFLWGVHWIRQWMFYFRDSIMMRFTVTWVSMTITSSKLKLAHWRLLRYSSSSSSLLSFFCLFFFFNVYCCFRRYSGYWDF